MTETIGDALGIDGEESVYDLDTTNPSEVETSNTNETSQGKTWKDWLQTERPEKSIEQYDTHDFNVIEHRALSHAIRMTEGFGLELAGKLAILDGMKAVYYGYTNKNPAQASNKGDGIEENIETQ